MDAYKVLVVGDRHVGKSEFIQKCAQQSLATRHQVTSGVDYYKLTVEKQPVTLWEISALEKHQQFGHLTNSRAVIIMFDTSNPKSLQKVTNYLDELQFYAGTKIVKVIVAVCSQLYMTKNKIDLGPVDDTSINQLKNKCEIFEFKPMSLLKDSPDVANDLLRRICAKITSAQPKPKPTSVPQQQPQTPLRDVTEQQEESQDIQPIEQAESVKDEPVLKADKIEVQSPPPIQMHSPPTEKKCFWCC